MDYATLTPKLSSPMMVDTEVLIESGQSKFENPT
jgi:hypothetical protein